MRTRRRLKRGSRLGMGFGMGFGVGGSSFNPASGLVDLRSNANVFTDGAVKILKASSQSLQIATVIPNAAFSLSFWLRIDSAVVVNDTIFQSSTNSGWTNGVGAFVSAADQLDFFVQGFASNVVRTGSIAFGDWNHFTFVWNETVLTLYVNGVAKPTTAYAGALTQGTNLYIGRDQSGAYKADQTQDSWGIWSRALTALEAASLYNSGAGKGYAGLTTGEKVSLVAWWGFRSATSLLVDSSGNSNTLTNNNAATCDAGKVLDAVQFDGDSVSVWSDRRNLTSTDTTYPRALQPVIGNRPLWKLNIQNGEPGILFDGVDDYMEMPLVRLQPHTLGLVGTATGAVAQTYSDDMAGSSLISNASATTKVRMSAGANLDKTGLAADAYRRIIAVFNGASSSLVVNGEAAVTGNAGASGGTTMTLGAKGDLSEPLAGYLFAIDVYDEALSLTNQQSLETIYSDLYEPPAPIDPLDLSPEFAFVYTNNLWQDTAMTVAASADRDLVSVIEDTSGHARHATIAGAAVTEPAFVEKGAFGGTLGGVYFNLSNLNFPDIALTQNAYTLIAQIVPLDITSGGYVILGGANANGILMVSDYIYSPQYLIYQDAAGYTPGASANHTSGTQTVILRVSSTGINVRVNGVEDEQLFAATGGALTIGTLGGLAAFPEHFYMQAMYGIPRVITDDEAELVRQFLALEMPAPTARFNTAVPLVVFDGNSLPARSPVTYPYIVQAMFTDANYVNLSMLGLDTPELNSSFTARVTPYFAAGRTLNVYVIDEIINDLFANNATAAEAFANIQDICDSARAAGFEKIIVKSCLPNVHQTGLPGGEAIRVACNALLDAQFNVDVGGGTLFKGPAVAGTVDADILLRAGDDADLGQPGDEADTLWYGDGAHTTQQGDALLAYRYFRPALDVAGIDMDAITNPAAATVAYWPFETLTTDSSGNGKTLTNNNGVTQVAGKIANCASFARASSQSFTRASEAGFQPNASFSMNAWVKLTAGIGDGEAYPIFGKGDPTLTGSDRGWRLAIVNSTRTLSGSFAPGDGTSAIPLNGIAVEAAVWTMVTLTYDATRLIARLYIQGMTFGYACVLPANMATNTSPLFIGGVAGIGYFNGLLDEVGYFNTCLTPDQVFGLWNYNVGIAHPFTAFIT